MNMIKINSISLRLPINGAHGSKALRFLRSVKTSTLDWKPMKSKTTNLALKEIQERSPWLRKFFLGLMIAMPVVSFGLGCWQVQRLDWKTKLIARCEHAIALKPGELPKDIDPSLIGDYEYRKVVLRGHFDYDNEMYLGPRFRDGEMGYLVVCPLIRSNGGEPILVERGWISKEKVIPSSRESGGYLQHLARPKGEIEVIAMLRVMPPKSYFQFSHEEGSRQFFIADVEAMAKQSGSLPVYCQAVYDLTDKPEWRSKEKSNEIEGTNKTGGKWLNLFSKEESGTSNARYMSDFEHQDATMEYQGFEFAKEGVPIGTIPKVNFKNNHVQYLVTWFGLSLFSGGLLIYSILKKGNAQGAEKMIEAKRKHMKNW